MIAERKRSLFSNPAWLLIAAFGTYFCMYGFRKPYTAATYEHSRFFGIDYKFLLVIAQTFGYVAAKWIGVKVVAEIKPARRIFLLLSLILGAEIMLLFFGFIPAPWNIVCILLNGLFLGVVFGLVLGFLEGRQKTELLVAGLCASFIVSDGVSKSVGKWLLDYGISENWMPFFAGLIFLLPSLLFIAMLGRIPAPSPIDVSKRSIRTPMAAVDRSYFFRKYAPGLISILIIYLFVTLLRSVRADFAPEIWNELGYKQTPALFTQSELLVSFAVIVVSGLTILFLDHSKAFRFSLFSCLAGFVLLLLAIVFLNNGMNGFIFMVFAGLGVYLPYVAVHTTVFERMIAVTREKANTGFLMYVADSVGYTGYILIMFLRFIFPSDNSILYLFLKGSLLLGSVGILIVLFANWYFTIKFKSNEQSVNQLSSGQSSYI